MFTDDLCYIIGLIIISIQFELTCHYCRKSGPMSEKKSTEMMKNANLENTHVKVDVRKKNRTLQIILGIIFILPAIGALILTQIIPTIMTFIQSFRSSSWRNVSEAVGYSNYEKMFSSPLIGQVYSFTGLLTITRVLMVLIPPLVLALGASSLKPVLRKFVRVFASVPWMIYSPMALSIVWLQLFSPIYGSRILASYMGDPVSARWLFLILDGISFLGLASGIGLTVYLSAIKSENVSGSNKRLKRSLILLVIILVLGTIALSLQGGDAIVSMTNGMPGNTTMTVYPYIVTLTFAFAQTGLAAALTSPLIIIIGLIGFCVGLLLILSNLRLFALPKQAEPVPLAKWLKILTMILMIFGLITILVSISPYIVRYFLLLINKNEISLVHLRELLSEIPIWKTLLNTWLVPVIIVLIVQLPLTYLGALGIGALRPFGKSSEWLLLIFAPWLFIRVLLLIPGMAQSLYEMRLMNGFYGFAIPYIINIPMLFILTLFFRGQTQKVADSGGTPKFFRDYILVSLPLTVICLVFSLMTIQQELLWSTLILSSPENSILPVLFRRIRGLYSLRSGELVALFTAVRLPASILSAIILIVYQVVYFPRLGIKVGKENNK